MWGVAVSVTVDVLDFVDVCATEVVPMCVCVTEGVHVWACYRDVAVDVALVFSLVHDCG